jgi:phenylacetate-CoA ligase
MVSKVKFYARFNFIFQNEIKKIDWMMNLQNFEDFREGEVVNYVNSVLKKNKFYLKLYSEHGVNVNQIKSLSDIDKLPSISKSDVILNSKEIINNYTAFKFPGYTSGSTGSPLKVYRSLRSIIKENAYVWWYRRNNGLYPKDKKVSIRGDLGVNELFRFEKTSNTLYISSYALNNQNLKKIVDEIRSFKPIAILGYPSSLYTIGMFLKDKKENLEIPLCFTSSETLLSFQKEDIVNYLQTEIFDWYGNAERTVALYSLEDCYYEPPLYSYFKVVEEGLLTTSLINNLFPLINYRVSDILEPGDKYVPKQKSNQYKRVIGRIEDYVTLPNGTKIGRLDVVFKKVEHIKFCQIVQKKKNEIIFNIVKENNFSDNDLRKLIANIEDRLGKEIKVSISFIDEKEIVYTSSNKFKLVLSLIDVA